MGHVTARPLHWLSIKCTCFLRCFSWLIPFVKWLGSLCEKQLKILVLSVAPGKSRFYSFFMQVEVAWKNWKKERLFPSLGAEMYVVFWVRNDSSLSFLLSSSCHMSNFISLFGIRLRDRGVIIVMEDFPPQGCPPPAWWQRDGWIFGARPLRWLSVLVLQYNWRRPKKICEQKLEFYCFTLRKKMSK